MDSRSYTIAEVRRWARLRALGRTTPAQDHLLTQWETLIAQEPNLKTITVDGNWPNLQVEAGQVTRKKGKKSA